MYNVFISYRKVSSINADHIRASIANNSAYSLDDIFLDKHSIGPELFDDKIRSAIASSNCVVLLVTKECFKPKEDRDEDWFIEEIRSALSLKKKIIPVLFDKIESLKDADILSELNKHFNKDEVEVLLKSQCVPYSTDFPDASIAKLVHFIDEANDTNGIFDKALNIVKVVCIILVALLISFALFFGLGFLWGYLTSSTNSDSVLRDNTTIDGNTLHFEYRGWDATYDVLNDTIFINLEEYNQEPKISNTDLVLSSFTFAGAKIILDKNLSYLKYLKFLKGGSKPAKVAFVCASAAACVGAFCGFSQGSSFGRIKRQEESAWALYAKLQYRSTWYPLIKDNIVLNRIYLGWESVKSHNSVSVGAPVDSTSMAYRTGLIIQE